MVLGFAIKFPLTASGQSEEWWGPSVRVLAETDSAIFAWSPDGRSFAYSGATGILLRNAPDFQSPRPMALSGWSGTEPITDLRWSPDGRRLAFVSPWEPGGWNTAWVVAPGGSVRDLLPQEVSGIFGSPGVRALRLGGWLNESDLVVEQHCGPECLAIYKVDAGASRYETLCRATVSEEIRWAPSMDRAVISGHNGALALARSEDFRPVAGGAFTEDSCREILPGCNAGSVVENFFSFESWSPDGKHALLTRRSCQDGISVAGPDSGGLYLWETELRRPDQLLSNAALAVWSPSGSQIAFILLKLSTRSDSTAGMFFDAFLGMLDITSKSSRVLATLGRIDSRNASGWPLLRPVWSPDGRRLAYHDAQHNLYVAQSDGSDPRLVVKEKVSLVHWSPDSKHLAIQIQKRPEFWVGAESAYLVEVD